MTWSVPGYRAERLLGRGATGEVWAGRDTATGEPVALKRLRPGRADVGREQLRREAALLAAFRHPHVIRLRGVLGTSGGLVLVLDLAPGGCLTTLLEERGRLRSGQVVALFAPLADALAAAHGAGLRHGDVSPGNVLLGESGGALLADLGTAHLAGDERAPVEGTAGYVDPAVLAGAAPGASSDVYSLAAVAALALVGRPVADDPDGVRQWAERALTLGVPPALVVLLCTALGGDPAGRPSAAALAEQLRAVCPPEALTALSPAAGAIGGGPEALTRRVPRPPREPDPAPPSGSAARLGLRRARRRPPGSPRPAPDSRSVAARRTALVATVVLVAMGLLGWVAFGPADEPGGIATGRRPEPRQAGTPASTPVIESAAAAVPSPRTAADWSRLLAGLDAQRTEAFARADPARLDLLYAPGSPPLIADRRAVQALRAAGATAGGVRHELRGVRVLQADHGRAELAVTDRLPAYRIVGSDGATLRTVPARGDRTHRMRLLRQAAGWRIAAIEEVRRLG